MKEETPEAFSITSIEFIFRHPWIFISSVVIIMSLVYGKVSLDPLAYESKAVLSFERGEAASDKFAERKLTSIKRNLVSKVLLGENIRGIIKKVWPDINEEKDSVEYNELLEELRDPKNGIQIGHDKKTPPSLLELSFKNKDPEICYKVVQATVDAIREENRRTIEGKIEARLNFLRDQIKFYKDKLDTITKEMKGIKDGLIEKFPELSEREKDLVAGIGGGEAGLIKQGTLETYVMYDEMLAKLNIELLEAQKKKENLERHLESGKLIPRLRSRKTADEDVFVDQYSKAIAGKELQIAELRARGYTENHPQIKKIQTELQRLRIMTGERIGTLREEGSEPLDETAAKEKILTEIEEIDFEIEALESKINLIEEYRTLSKEQLKTAPAGEKDNIQIAVTKLQELEKEKEINERYYLDIRKQLEEAELKARLEKEEGGLTIDIIEEPSVPLNPISYQKVKLLMLGFIISLMVGSGLAYFVDSLDNSVRSAKELRELFNIPVLASIDKICTPKEILAKRVRRNTIIISLFIFVILSRIFIKLLLAIF
jgi:hypothetical protein